ncbi:MAG: S8 family serine peptidase [candidate division WOR-3 bacterium]
MHEFNKTLIILAIIITRVIFAGEMQQESSTAICDLAHAGITPVFSNVVKTRFIPETYGDATKISFANGISFDTRLLGKTGEPDLPSELKVQYRDDETGYYIVQFSGPVYGPEKDWLEAQGVKVHFYIPNYGFVISLKERRQKDVILANPSVNWLGVYQPAYKISPLFDCIRNQGKVVILLFNDAEINSVVEQINSITTKGEFEISDNGINKMILCQVAKKDLDKLAHIKEICWIEPYLQPVLFNQQCQWVIQCGWLSTAPSGSDNTYRRVWAMGIMGQGEIINHCDSGINTEHYQHRAGSDAITTWGVYPNHNKIVAYDSGAPSSIQFGDGSGASWHGTHTACTATGNDTTLGTSFNDGIAKMARIYHNDCGNNSDNTIQRFPDLNNLYIRPYNKYYQSHGIRAYLSTNSWGADAMGYYTIMAYNVDQFMWSHKDFLLFYAAGNQGSSGARTIASPASAKSCVAVGGTLNSTACRSYFSSTSRGPTQDGRIKPTVLAPADGIYSAGSGTSGYQTMSGTSMAAPGATGAGALIRQYLREGWYPSGKRTPANGWSYISAAVIKAILINCADPNITGYTVPDSNVGWGRIDLDSALYFAGDTRKLLLVDDTIGILTGERKDYYFYIPSGAANLKITLVWTDYPGNPAVLKQIVNDLDLYVQNPSGTYYRGNQYSSGQSVANPSVRDTLNVEECVRVNSPAAGNWLVRVEGRNVPCGPQPFALVIAYSGTSEAGVITTNKTVYRANDFFVDTIRVRVEDKNFGNAGVRDTVVVVFRSKYLETQPETLRCVELAESSYVFKGEMPLLFRGPVHGDGKLSVCQGDTIYVSYTDNNPTYISTIWAAVDAWYFLISDVHCENIKGNSAEICWNTNENSTSKVYYGTNPSNLNLVVNIDTLYHLFHRVLLSGLSTNTIYYYDVESKDFRGHIVRDNNGGQHYRFKTSSSNVISQDILVILANGKDDGTGGGMALPQLKEKFNKAVEQGGWTYNFWQTSDYNGYTPSREVMKNAKAVYVVFEDEYPPFLQAQQETIKKYEERGGRIAFASHEVLWHSWQYSSNKSYDTTWCKNYLQARYKADLTSTGTFNIYGVSGDPISGPYAENPVSYTPHRTGAAGDSFDVVPTPPNGWDPGGASSVVWRWNATNGGRVGVRWESGSNHGTAGDGIWGGYKTRTIYNGFSITQMDTTKLPAILNNQFIWLIGHDHPDVTISSPSGGEVYTSSPVTIAWSATTYGGTQVDTTWIEYSSDGGSIWNLIAYGTNLTSPYSWNISALPNGNKYRVRVMVNDKNVYPSLKGFAETANFRIAIPGNDNIGPKILANSINVANNPKFVSPSDTILTFTAVVSDSDAGFSTISAASYIVKSPNSSSGEAGMQASDGSWDEVAEEVIGNIRLTYTPNTVRICSLFVRGRDGANNWGGWFYRTFTLINGDIRPVGIEEIASIPMVYHLAQPMPNPGKGIIRIDYAIPKKTNLYIKIYNCLGQVERTLVDEEKEPGYYSIHWDGRDDKGKALAAGIYFCRMTAEEFVDTRKIILLK